MSKIGVKPLNYSWIDFPDFIQKHLNILPQGSTIVEIGGGANPALSKRQAQNYNYTLIDINQEELLKSKERYFTTLCLDITKEQCDVKCDLIITQMLLEHIPNPEAFHKACHNMLNTNGYGLHFFATKFSPASCVNLVLPEHLSKRLLYKIQNRKWETEGKFPAYYRWTLGPTKKQIHRFNTIGFSIDTYFGYLGSGYLKHIKYLKNLEYVWNYIVLKLGSPLFCSNAILIVKK